MNYTPGPWKADIRTGCVAVYPANENHNCLSGIEKALIHYQDGKGDRYLGTYPMLTDEQVANARLIAAAPQLLKALKTMLRGDEIGEVECQRTDFPRMIDRRDMARAAIAAAEGRA